MGEPKLGPVEGMRAAIETWPAPWEAEDCDAVREWGRALLREREEQERKRDRAWQAGYDYGIRQRADELAANQRLLAEAQRVSERRTALAAATQLECNRLAEDVARLETQLQAEREMRKRLRAMFDRVTPILQTIERQAEVLNRRAGDTRPAETILYELGKLKLSRVEEFLLAEADKGGNDGR